MPLRLFSVSGSITPRRNRVTWPVLEEMTTEMHCVATAIAAAVALALVWGFAPPFRQAPAAPPVAVALELVRGDENPRARAPARRPLLLTLDLTGVAALDSYQVRIVDGRGAAVLDAAAKPDHERLSVAASVRLARGIYWVRLYNPSQPQRPLREYGLALE